MYVFWEPANAADLQVLSDHLREVVEFAGAVSRAVTCGSMLVVIRGFGMSGRMDLPGMTSASMLRDCGRGMG